MVAIEVGMLVSFYEDIMRAVDNTVGAAVMAKEVEKAKSSRERRTRVVFAVCMLLADEIQINARRLAYFSLMKNDVTCFMSWILRERVL